jgi:hypothetical protein
MQAIYADVVRGRRPEYFEWLTPVYKTLGSNHHMPTPAAIPTEVAE